MLGEGERVPLRSGGWLGYGLDRAIDGAQRLWVTLGADHAPPVVVSWPVPPAGYGGGELVISPDERFAALWLYSGQSEQGYELFELVPTLRHVGGLPYVPGQGDACVFSPDEKWLAMVVTSGPRVRGTEAHAEDVLDPDATDEVVVEWATLYVQPLPEGGVTAHAIGSRVLRSMPYDDLAAWEVYEAVGFIAPGRLGLALPWGEALEVALPVVGEVTTHGPVPRP